MTAGHGKIALRYLLVGAANSVIYSCLLWVFLSYSDFAFAISIAFAFIIAMCFQYFANKYFTFGVNSASFGEAVRYLVAAATNYLVSVLAIWICLDILDVSKLLASLFSAFSAAVAGYFLSFFWVYRK
jgi:putative flippase GtrA